MKIVNFRNQSNPSFRLGVKLAGGILDVAAACKSIPGMDCPELLDELFSAAPHSIDTLSAMVSQIVAHGMAEWMVDETSIEYGPCVPPGGKIICVGLNYRQHAHESGLAVPETPVLFSKFGNALAACGEDIPLGSNAEQYDYEVELVAVIGKRGKYISEDKALDYVLGYCSGNDLSARDLQMRTSQWLLGKTPDKFMPVGPYLVTADEVGDPGNKAIRCWLNGEMRQDSNTSDMVFSVPELVSYISQYITLVPGDLISTGTPQGVILGMPEKIWLKPGDEVVVEVEGLGRLTNRMVSEG